MSLSVGIVGLPNVGKSTLFQALTKKQVDIANYPFTTIKPNVGVVAVPDERLDKLALLFQSERKIPAVIEFVDIAGLVRGSHKGEGLGNQFLAHIRETAAMVEVVRCFEDDDIIHVEQTIDPVRDIETIQTELELKDLETVDKLCAKPVIFVFNSNTPEIPDSLKNKIKSMGAPYVVANLKEELELAALSRKELEELGIEPKLPELIKKTYELLGLITFFTTTGTEETRAWTVKKSTTAPRAGGIVHSDFEEKFIKAEVIAWDKLLEVGGWAQAAAKGWLKTEGKEYVVQDGDVIKIKHAP